MAGGAAAAGLRVRAVRRTGAVAALVVAVFLFAPSCSSSAPTGAAPAGGPTSSAPETSEQGGVPFDGALDPAQAYLAMAAPANCERQRLVDLLEQVDGRPWAGVRTELLEQYRRAAEASVSFYEGLLAASWPTDVAADVERLANEVATWAAHFDAMSKVTDAASDRDRVGDSPEQSNTAGVVRAKLGAPSNVLAGSDACA